MSSQSPSSKVNAVVDVLYIDVIKDVTAAMDRARKMKNESPDDKTRQNAEFIEETLLRVADKMTEDARRAKASLEKLMNSN
jgi:hypothetical protein